MEQKPPPGYDAAQGQQYPPGQPGPYPAAPGGYPPVQGGYPPAQGGYPPGQGGYPPGQGGYPQGQGGYPQGQGGYPQGQGAVIVQPMHTTAAVVVAGGACGRCGRGPVTEGYTLCGIILAIVCFPIGIICCLMMKDRKCASCGASY